MFMVVFEAETNSTWLSPTTIISILTAIITIAGWSITAKLSRNNASKESQNKELNQLIDDLDFVIETIHLDMIDLFSNQGNTLPAYHKFVSSATKVRFICEEIEKIDHTQKPDFDLIGRLRQACTNDRNYEKTKLPVTLSEIQFVHQDIRKKYSKKFS
ncbi:hypothetical protein KC982_17920 [Proteus mirabilis]|uniref:hypothetical protein n=1 Tax=Proteus mirabilis TaxID=584 RepID=UPI000EF9D72E|nr:hypothetical protein [Proteus mirabilis]MDF7205382.1 hypothetical protein [Proteus mirabilis]MDL2103341.1 hypothetical protein [Proteus mirabilis]RLZ28978.1 hypothetical protein EA137_02025 [Proteus mirabilis]HCT3327166.1 hypothetical protein [Proteus mirabilis]HEK1157863.1 hypothetical protein [Proteus mirabilis]